MAEETTAPAEGQEQTTTAPPAEQTGQDSKLGPEGEKALQIWKDRAKQAEKDAKGAAELQKRLDDITEANKTENEKALDKARKEAKTEAEAEFQGKFRAAGLEVAVAKHARELADVDLVLLRLNKDISDGEIDESKLFDGDGKVKPDVLKQALEELLQRQPLLKAQGVGRPQGSANGGEGEGGGAPSFNDELRKRAGY